MSIDDPDRPPVVKKERAIASKTIAAVAVAFVLLAFSVSNTDRVQVDYLVTTSSTPLIAVIVVCSLLGALVGGLTAWRRKR